MVEAEDEPYVLEAKAESLKPDQRKKEKEKQEMLAMPHGAAKEPGVKKNGGREVVSAQAREGSHLIEDAPPNEMHIEGVGSALKVRDALDK